MKAAKLLLWTLCVVVLGFLAGYLLRGSGTAPPGEPHEHAADDSRSASRPAVWTCPMHPQIRESEPGKCRICGMTLVKAVVVGADEGDPGPRRLRMSEAGKKLAEIVTAPVERRFVETEVRMVGLVDYDETRVRTISAWVPGRLDRLYVDFTGTSVRKGDHLVWLYSPDILTAQEELLEQKRLLVEAKNERSDFLRKSSRRALASARDKLRLWGLSDAQIAEIEARGTAEDHMMIPSPSSGIVIHKALDEGAYVQVGTPIYKIAQLDELWVQLDAYESDLPWVRYGQDAWIETESYPGEVFHGRISFVSPELDRRTRTIKVRVNVENRNEKLKPGMFVRAIVRARIARGGKVMDPRLAGKWICPMHPAVVEDEKKPCRICGMDLVRAESLGYVALSDEAEKPLVVPATAVLWTGKRAVVYVAVPAQSKPTYEGREVILGARARDHYLVLSGLAEGERVVVHGSFKIDSALQIQAKPSMMSVPGQSASKARVPAAFLQALVPVWSGYFAFATAIAADDLDTAKRAAAGFGRALGAISAAGLPSATRAVWLRQADRLAHGVVEAAAAKDLEALRVTFGTVAAGMVAIENAVGHSGTRPHYEVFCPMAFGGKGAAWLQQDAEVHNPFYGTAMPHCGNVKTTHPASGKGAEIPRPAPGGAGGSPEHGGSVQKKGR